MCIRDRYMGNNNESFAKIKKKITHYKQQISNRYHTNKIMMRALVFLALVVFASTQREPTKYDKCDPRWVIQLYEKPNICGTPQVDKIHDAKASFATLLADFLTNEGIACLEIHPCTPAVLFKHPDFDNKHKLEQSLGIRFGEFTTNIPQLKKMVQEGASAIISTSGDQFYIAYHVNLYGLSGVDARGQEVILMDGDVVSGFPLEIRYGLQTDRKIPKLLSIQSMSKHVFGVVSIFECEIGLIAVVVIMDLSGCVI
eukprot:TRINITY_DN581_c0_g1_i4.p1 TRINITY_DN581_c0_g1~~TRINITY_DN581_c0_g1_i4.p1  ORF type:complete len:272 (-),score=69.98 TRINITY_DN581_c0_g1_i4:113-880(-)